MPPATTLPPASPWADGSMSEGVEANDISLRSVWRALLRQRYVVLGVLCLSLLAGLYLAHRKRVYVATGSLQVRSGSSNRFRYGDSGLGGSALDLDDRIESEVSVLESKSLYLKVAEQLHLASNPAILGKFASPHASMTDPVVQARMVAALEHMIKIERIPKTDTITISCTTTSPLLSTQIVSTLMNQYVERIFQTQFSSTQRASQFLASQLNDLKNQVLGDQQKLVDLQGRLGVIGFDDTHNLITAQLEDLARANEQADVARITAEARYRILEDERPDLVEGGPPMLSSTAQPTPGSLLQTLRSSEAQLRTQYANVSEQFGQNYPETKRLKAELAEATAAVAKEQTRVLEQAKIAFNAASSNQNMTQSALAAAEGKALGKRNDMVQYEILLHDYQSSRTLYEGLTQRLREAGVVSGLESAEIELIDLPLLPVSPSGYGPLMLIAISLVLGLVVGFVVAMLVEAADTSVHNVDELERYLGLPSLAVLPQFDAKNLARRAKRDAGLPAENKAELPALEVLHSPLSPFSEGLRLLRSGLLLTRTGEAPRSFLFTSAMPSEGKSTVASNLACVLAQNGASVLLVEVDLRHPTAAKQFGLSNRKGLSTFLNSACDLHECTQKIAALPTLQVLTSGPAVASPGLLLGSERMRGLLKKARADFDFVILDTPPGLAIADAGILAASVDAVLLVVRDGVANRKMVRRAAVQMLRLGAQLHGFVFNGIRKNSVEYYEYRGRNGAYSSGRHAPNAGEADAGEIDAREADAREADAR